MNEQKCPVCKRDSYLNPNMKILISPCFHKLCEQCAFEIFSHGYAPCPQCGVKLRKINFITSTFEDANVECEIRVRKMLYRNFTRSEDNFETSEEYNDYLEAFENLVFYMLELKNEELIKEEINTIKNSNSILNPVVFNKKKSNLDEEMVKRIKKNITVQTWCIFKEKGIKLQKEILIPKNIFTICEGSGVTNKTVAMYFISGIL